MITQKTLYIKQVKRKIEAERSVRNQTTVTTETIHILIFYINGLTEKIEKILKENNKITRDKIKIAYKKTR